MQNFRVDQSDITGQRAVTDPEPVMDFASGEVIVNQKTGERDWRIGVAVRKVDQRRASVIEVKVRSVTAPPVAEGDAVTLVGLTANYWERDGKSGLSFRAESVTKRTETKGAATVGASVTASPAVTGSAAASTASRTRGGESG